MDTPKVPRPVRKRRRAVEVDRLRELALQQMLDRLEQGELSVAELLKVIALEAPPQTEKKRPDGDWVLQLLEDPPDEGQ
ncbi:MAG: hypothetical protein GX650_07795 [Clostridiales bacterium]|nr:hypothetical protein [Clostridiales bacterium]